MDEKLPWVEKYRPNTLDDIICQNHIVSTLKELLKTRSLPNMIFFGPPGTGKTSTIITCINQMYDSNKCEVIILNASDERGIDTVRQRIKDFSVSVPLFNNDMYKIVILDEADSMTEEAQYSLRQIIMNNINNVRFCIICNYIHRIIPALQSRCSKFRFIPLPDEYIRKYMKSVCVKENMEYTEEGLSSLIKISGGDLRKSLNIAQTISLINNKLTYDNVYDISNYPNKKIINEVLNIILNNSINKSYHLVNNLILINGLCMSNILEEISIYISSIYLPSDIHIILLNKLGILERRLSLKYYNNNTQTSFLICCLQEMIEFLFKSKN